MSRPGGEREAGRAQKNSGRADGEEIDFACQGSLTQHAAEGAALFRPTELPSTERIDSGIWSVSALVKHYLVTTNALCSVHCCIGIHEDFVLRGIVGKKQDNTNTCSAMVFNGRK